MLQITSMLALALGVAACAEVAAGPDGGFGERDEEHASLSAQFEHVQHEICTVLPPEGVCALACDHDALVAEFVPRGTCATFLCELLDGRSIALSACHPDD